MPKGYIVAEIQITDRIGIKAYRRKVQATVAAYDGRFLVRAEDTAVVEGEEPGGAVIVLEFESPARAMEWYNSPEYQAILPLRLRASTARVTCAAGTSQGL